MSENFPPDEGDSLVPTEDHGDGGPTEDSPEVVSRRRFLGIVTVSAAGVITAGLGVPAFLYVFDPARTRTTTEEWVLLGSIVKIEPGVPALMKTRQERKFGWVTETEELAFYVSTEDGRTFTALSNICTHLGCRVRWVEDSNSFFCPCHNGIFTATGAVESGPPPRPLDQFEVKVEEDQVFIKLKA